MSSGDVRSYESLARAAPGKWEADLLATVYAWRTSQESKRPSNDTILKSGSALTKSVSPGSSQSGGQGSGGTQGQAEKPSWPYLASRPPILVDIGANTPNDYASYSNGCLYFENGIWKIGTPPTQTWEIESFPRSFGQMMSDGTGELWHPFSPEITGKSFGWIFPRKTFKRIKYFSTEEMPMYASFASTSPQGSIYIYGINKYKEEKLLTSFKKVANINDDSVFSRNGEMMEMVTPVDLDVSGYDCIGIIMDPWFYDSAADGLHVVAQMTIPQIIDSSGVDTFSSGFLVTKVMNMEATSILSAAKNITDPRLAMTHWMKVGVQ